MHLAPLALALVASVLHGQAPDPPRPAAVPQRNLVLILVDDLRHDVFGFAGHPWIETPHLDALARGGARFRNAFVTTALCSPSRASILTGLYPSRHRVIDNNRPVPAGTTFFPQHLQRAGYATAFVGKWHMGHESDAPQPGFDHWVSFRGQGTYAPNRRGFNVDGARVPAKTYVTDELTEYALAWLARQDGRKPFFLYLSHKAVHADFAPAERHRGRYATRPWTPPATMADDAERRANHPMWVTNQRNSHHGVDFAYHQGLDVGAYYRRYCETLLAVDDSVGRLVGHLRERGMLEHTLIVFTGDNGFLFGEHGLIDKRVAYEESIRVPMLAHCPDAIRPGTEVERLVLNLDLAPTFLDAGGVRPPEAMDGRSFLPLARGEAVPWRESFVYTYYWERNFPHTPTVHALRGERYKLVRCHGLWDTDELYDLVEDPHETRNLVRDPAHRARAQELRAALFAELERTGGLQMPLWPDVGGASDLRSRTGAAQAAFPDWTFAPTTTRPTRR